MTSASAIGAPRDSEDGREPLEAAPRVRRRVRALVQPLASGAPPVVPANIVPNVRPDPAISARINKAGKRAAKLERRLERAIARGDKRAQRRDARRLLTSYDVKISENRATAKARRKKGRAAPEGQALLDLAKAISATRAPAPTRENTIRVWPKWKKRPGDFRIIRAFPMVDEARNNLVKRVLSHFLQVGPNQFGTQNGGTNAAIARVKAQAANPANRYVATCDIQNFYPSLDRKWLRHELARVSFGAIGEKVTTRPCGRIAIEFRLGVPLRNQA